jgi:hypothetical protein
MKTSEYIKKKKETSNVFVQVVNSATERHIDGEKLSLRNGYLFQV